MSLARAREAVCDVDAGTAPPPDPWAEEVLDRIRGAIERSRRDPHVVFSRFCSDGLDALRKDDLGRVLQAFFPAATEALQARIWREFGKADGDVMTFQEFCRLCSLQPPSEFRAEAADEPEGTTTAVGAAVASTAVAAAADAAAPSEPVASDVAGAAAAALEASGGAAAASVPAPPGCRRSGAPLDERRARVLLYRFGRAITVQDSATREELLRPREDDGLTLPELLQVASRHDIPLSRPELVALFMRFGAGQGHVPRSKFFAGVLQAAGGEPPHEVVEGRRVLAAAAATSKCEEKESCALWGELLHAGGDEGATDGPSVRELLARHTAVDDEHWECVDLSLDKRPDGAVLLAPLLEFVAGAGAGSQGASAAAAEPPPTLRPQNKHKDLLNNSWIPRHHPKGPLPPVSEEGEESEDTSAAAA